MLNILIKRGIKQGFYTRSSVPRIILPSFILFDTPQSFGQRYFPIRASASSPVYRRTRAGHTRSTPQGAATRWSEVKHVLMKAPMQVGNQVCGAKYRLRRSSEGTEEESAEYETHEFSLLAIPHHVVHGQNRSYYPFGSSNESVILT
jgi:hypothetical protein